MERKDATVYSVPAVAFQSANGRRATSPEAVQHGCPLCKQIYPDFTSFRDHAAACIKEHGR